MKKIAIICLVFISIFIAVCFIELNVVYPLKYKQEILESSKKYNLDASLVASVICTESRFNKNAVSSTGAKGLMQIMPSTFSWVAGEIELGENSDILDPAINIEVGCYYLSYLIKKYNNMIYCLACYNAGEGVVSKWGASTNFKLEQIVYPETYNYVKKVTKLINFYKSRF